MYIVQDKFSETCKNERFDAQFFNPEYIRTDKIISAKQFDLLSKIAYITDGNHLQIAESFDLKDGVRYLRGQDISKDI